MLHVNKRLKELGPNHLPPGFDAKKGIAKLFPQDWRRSPCRVSQMKQAIYTFGTSNWATPSGEVSGTFLVMMDWCGNWFFDFYLVQAAGVSGNWGAGFVFKFSKNLVGHGYTTTGSYSTGTDYAGCTSQSVSGTDPWIRDNWNELIAEGVRTAVGNHTGWGSGPDMVGYALQGTGLTTLQDLGGARPSPVSQGANLNNSCWFAVSSAWGIPAYSYQAGAQVGPPPSGKPGAPGPAAPWAQPGYPGSLVECTACCSTQCPPPCCP